MPEDARLVPGAAEALTTLAGIFELVGVLSGRPVDFLRPMFPSSVMLAGLYGLERLQNGERIDHPLGGSWREVIDDVASLSRARGPAGMHVESKGLSITLHYRGRPRLEPRVRAFAESQAIRSGLECRPARMSYELHPPIPADKGSALLELSEGLSAVAFIGDDVGDLPRLRRARSAVDLRRSHRTRGGAQCRGVRRAHLASRRGGRRSVRCPRSRAVLGRARAPRLAAIRPRSAGRRAIVAGRAPRLADAARPRRFDDRQVALPAPGLSHQRWRRRRRG